MSVLLLRKMTRLSKISLGKNAGLTVGEVMKKCKLDIIYSYFHYDMITFTDDILDELLIRPEDRIEKPGKAPEKHDYYRHRNNGLAAKITAKHVAKKLKRQGIAVDDETFEIIQCKAFTARQKKITNARYRQMKARDRLNYSKGSLMARNHGHF